MTGTNDRILLSHGSGGSMMHKLIQDLFMHYFHNPLLNKGADAAILPGCHTGISFTTDSFVVNPLFFPGGNIGKLAVCGTINDLVTSGAVPYCLSAGFIIEEGLPMHELEAIVKSMAREAGRAGVFIATGDTKVVEKGKCDSLFLNTSGIGFLPAASEQNSVTTQKVTPGDHIIISGYIGDHGMAVMAARNGLDESLDFESDCAPLNGLLHRITEEPGGIRFMRDPTRGGVATTLCELALETRLGAVIFEDQIPVRPAVRGLCDLLGFDPLYVANEGKMLIVTDPEKTKDIMAKIKSHPLGKEASVIGEVSRDHPGMVRLQTSIGGSRIINMPAGEQLPRIC